MAIVTMAAAIPLAAAMAAQQLLQYAHFRLQIAWSANCQAS
ncbi:hypothetical protein [Achromobacter anxifer]|nr:hypothetical protein [Achromobacter anxifer]